MHLSDITLVKQSTTLESIKVYPEAGIPRHQRKLDTPLLSIQSLKDFFSTIHEAVPGVHFEHISA